ncbi:MAG: NAD-dependent epimerase/dehydratase family protein [Solirubrobacterales bacterium]
MRVALAGASGVIGGPLISALNEAGHEVTGITRSGQGAERIRAAGGEPAVADVLDREQVTSAITAARPEVVVSHLTKLPPDLNPRNMKQAYAANDQIRGEGTANMLAGAKSAGARRILVQNICFMYAAEGDSVKSEDAPLYSKGPEHILATVRLHQEMERSVTERGDIEGLVLRFGFWYGPGTSFASDGYSAGEVKKRRFPIVGDGAGIFSFCHIDDVVGATMAGLTAGDSGIHNVCDDEPAPVRDWLPEYARALGAPPPRRVPKWLARFFVGGYGATMMTKLRGASNEKAKRELGWTPRYPSWRQGFREGLG